MAAPAKRTALTVLQRLEAVELLDHGMSCRKVADYFGVGKTQIQNINKRKREFLDEFDDMCTFDRKRKTRKTKNKDINILVWEWFQEAKTRAVDITKHMIKEQGLKVAKDLDIHDFKASNGWLDSFMKRYGINFDIMSDDTGDNNTAFVTEWKSKLPAQCKNYAPRDIFKFDETSLFFRADRAKSFYVKGEKCSGSMLSKERLTVALCSNLKGDKETAVVIGKHANPKCFKRIPTSSLPVKYYSSNNATMTCPIFEDWIKSFDKKMRQQGRHVLLFLEIASSHPFLELPNVKMQFLPPEKVFESQPMNLLTIEAVKLKYRKRQLQQVLKLMENSPSLSGSDLLRKVTMLDAIYWLNQAWKEIDVTTISKGFSTFGIIDHTISEIQKDDQDNIVDDGDDYIPLEVLKLSNDVFGVPFEELKDMDELLTTCIEDDSDCNTTIKMFIEKNHHNETVGIFVEDYNDESDEDDDCGETSMNDCENVTKSQAYTNLEGLRNYALSIGNVHILNSVMDIEHHLIGKSASPRVRALGVPYKFGNHSGTLKIL